jgi:hypothetical protein
LSSCPQTRCVGSRRVSGCWSKTSCCSTNHTMERMCGNSQQHTPGWASCRGAAQYGGRRAAPRRRPAGWGAATQCPPLAPSRLRHHTPQNFNILPALQQQTTACTATTQTIIVEQRRCSRTAQLLRAPLAAEARCEFSPVSSLTTVDLPAPLGPTIATRELRLACSVTPATMARSVLGYLRI